MSPGEGVQEPISVTNVIGLCLDMASYCILQHHSAAPMDSTQMLQEASCACAGFGAQAHSSSVERPGWQKKENKYKCIAFLRLNIFLGVQNSELVMKRYAPASAIHYHKKNHTYSIHI